MSKIKILYLDANNYFLNEIKLRLEWKGYHVSITNNERSLLAKINSCPYDLLIINITTPSFNAFLLLKHLKEDSTLPPTIAVGESKDYRLVTKAMNTGCVDYVLKSSFIENYFDQLNLSIFQVLEKIKTLKIIHTKKNHKKSFAWEYFPLLNLVYLSSPDDTTKSFTYDEFISKVHLEDLALVKTQNNRCLYSRKPVKYRFRYLSDNNTVTTFTTQIKSEVNDKTEVIRLFGILHPVFSQYYSEENLRIKLSFLDNTSDALFITNKKKQIISINDSFTRLTGYSEKQILYKDATLLHADNLDPLFFKHVFQHLQDKHFWQGEVIIRHREGHSITTWQSTSIIKDPEGNVTQSISVSRDISKQKAHEKSITFLANYDALTQLPNRTLFLDRLSKSIQLSKRNNNKLGLMLIDLNHFKLTNDRLGHHAGDILLQETAKKLQQSIRDSDTVARIGGDEFSIIIPNLEKTIDIESITKKIINSFKQPILIEQQEIVISCSIGITIFPEDGESITTLQKNADSAMYLAKKKGRSYYFYTPAIQKRSEKRLRLLQEMRSAIKHKEFSLHYQPIIDIHSNKITSAETLLRWQHPKFGYIPLNQFIPAAEESGFIKIIGDWVIEEVANNIQRWATFGLAPLQISLNQSVAQYNAVECHSKWLDILQNNQIKPDTITFEIPEKLFIHKKPDYIKSICELKQAGVKISLDSFGTGISSLNYLKKYPVDAIKIDRSYIHQMTSDSTHATFVETIVMLANDLNLKVIATGVENKEQLELLNRQCRYAQGYYFSKPLPLNEFGAFVKIHNRV